MLKFSYKTIPHTNTALFLGITLDANLHKKARVKKEKRRSQAQVIEIVLDTGKEILITLYDKLLLYRQILKTFRPHGVQLWVRTKHSIININSKLLEKDAEEYR